MGITNRLSGCRGGDSGEVGVLRCVVESDQLSDGTASGVDGGGERVVRGVAHAAAGGGVRRRLISGPFSDRHTRLPPLPSGTL